MLRERDGVGRLHNDCVIGAVIALGGRAGGPVFVHSNRAGSNTLVKRQAAVGRSVFVVAAAVIEIGGFHHQHRHQGVEDVGRGGNSDVVLIGGLDHHGTVNGIGGQRIAYIDRGRAEAGDGQPGRADDIGHGAGGQTAQSCGGNNNLNVGDGGDGGGGRAGQGCVGAEGDLAGRKDGEGWGHRPGQENQIGVVHINGAAIKPVLLDEDGLKLNGGGIDRRHENARRDVADDRAGIGAADDLRFVCHLQIHPGVHGKRAGFAAG